MNNKSLLLLTAYRRCIAGILQHARDTVLAALAPPPRLGMAGHAGAAPVGTGSARHRSTAPRAALLKRPRTAMNTAAQLANGRQNPAQRQTLQRRSQHEEAPSLRFAQHLPPCMSLPTWQAVTGVEQASAAALLPLLSAGRAPAKMAGKLWSHIRTPAIPRHLSRHVV